MIALLVITDGRWDYLQDALASVRRSIPVDWAQKILVDDSGLPERPPVDLDGWTLVKHDERRGLAGAVQSGWDHLWNVDFVWHQEDDFVFPGTVPIWDMVDALERHPELAQVALLRQPWSPEEKMAGGIYGLYREHFTDSDGLVWHERLFTFNPSLYRREIATTAGLERDVTDRLLAEGWKFAYLGSTADEPRCWHIGVRHSQGYRW